MNIPSFQDIPVIVKRGDDYYWSDEWRNIMQQLIQALQLDASDEGLVAPTQTSAASPNNKIQLIQNNQLSNGSYTCKFGTMLYDSTNNSGRFCVNNGAGIPLFKTITLT